MKSSFPRLEVLAVLAILLPSASAQFTQQGNKLVGTGANGLADQGYWVALSRDGLTAIVGGPFDGSVAPNTSVGAAWVFTRSNPGAPFAQQGPKLAANDEAGDQGLGESVAISADGNTAIMGGYTNGDNTDGAAWVFTRSNGVWTQQGPKLVPSDVSGIAQVGESVALSDDGNTALVGGNQDNGGAGAVWVFTRSNGVWTQQGHKLVGAGAAGPAQQGWNLALSADGNTALSGGWADSNETGAVWVFTRSGGAWSQQGNKLVGANAIGQSFQGDGVALSADGNTALVGGDGDNNNLGAVWVFTRANGAWSQQGGKLLSSDNIGQAHLGGTVALTAGGNTALVSGARDNNSAGAAWVFTRANGAWSQQGGKLVGSGAVGAARQGFGLAISADGSTALVGGDHDTPGETSFGTTAWTGAVWVFTQPVTPGVPAPGGVSPASGSASSQTMSFTFTDSQGYDLLGVVNILVNNFLDGRSACYLAYSLPSNVLYLVGDNGGALLAGSPLNAPGSTSNSQCAVSWGGSPVTGIGNTLTLTLTFTFTSAFAGNRIVYMAARDQSAGNSGWQPLGTWQVPGGAPATTTAVVGMNPASGSGLGPTPYTFSFSDSKGFQDLGVENILVNSSLDGRQACYLAYDRRVNVLYLVNDNGDGLLPGQVLAASGTVGNSQCTVAWGASPVTASGNSLALAFSITFTAAFDGNRIFYLAARDVNDLNNTGWEAMGTRAIQ